MTRAISTKQRVCIRIDREEYDAKRLDRSLSLDSRQGPKLVAFFHQFRDNIWTYVDLLIVSITYIEESLLFH